VLALCDCPPSSGKETQELDYVRGAARCSRAATPRELGQGIFGLTVSGQSQGGRHLTSRRRASATSSWRACTERKPLVMFRLRQRPRAIQGRSAGHSVLPYTMPRMMDACDPGRA
jgi:hypothetical protein